jgi:biopolymer transport protein TolR
MAVTFHRVCLDRKMKLVRKSRTSPRLFSDFNTLQVASVMAMVVFITLLVFMTLPTPHHGVSVDLPKVSHPISMPGALREDMMKVFILRDGKVYLGGDRIDVINLPAKVQDRLKDRGVERKVYVVADTRAQWGTVKTVLDQIRSAGIIRIAFLVY